MHAHDCFSNFDIPFPFHYESIWSEIFCGASLLLLCIVCKWMHLHVYVHKYLHVYLHKYFPSRWYDLARRSSCWKQVSRSPLLGLLVAPAKWNEEFRLAHWPGFPQLRLEVFFSCGKVETRLKMIVIIDIILRWCKGSGIAIAWALSLVLQSSAGAPCNDPVAALLPPLLLLLFLLLILATFLFFLRQSPSLFPPLSFPFHPQVQMTRPLPPRLSLTVFVASRLSPVLSPRGKGGQWPRAPASPLTINSLRFPFNSLLLFSVSLTYHQNITRGRQALTKKGF